MPDQEVRTPDDEVSYKDLKFAYEEALSTMPEKIRTVFLMNRIDGLKYREMADQLGLSVKAIEKRMSQALEYMKVKLKDKVNMMVLFLAAFTLHLKNREQVR